MKASLGGAEHCESPEPLTLERWNLVPASEPQAGAASGCYSSSVSKGCSLLTHRAASHKRSAVQPISSDFKLALKLMVRSPS